MKQNHDGGETLAGFMSLLPLLVLRARSSRYMSSNVYTKKNVSSEIADNDTADSHTRETWLRGKVLCGAEPL